MNDDDRRRTNGRPIIHRGFPPEREFAIQTVFVGSIIPVALIIKAVLTLRDGFVRYEHEASAHLSIKLSGFGATVHAVQLILIATSIHLFFAWHVHSPKNKAFIRYSKISAVIAMLLTLLILLSPRETAATTNHTNTRDTHGFVVADSVQIIAK
jgi:cytochrome bd-type quinol oxidase subunit 2